MMDGYHMTGWAWFSMATMVIVAIAIAGVVVWAVNVTLPTDLQPTSGRPASNSTRGWPVGRSTRRNIASDSTRCSGITPTL